MKDIIHLKYTLPHTDECKHLIYKIIFQAIRDFFNLKHSALLQDQFDYNTACEFLFDDTYTIDYGGTDKSFKDLLDILDMDIVWLREKIIAEKNIRLVKLRTWVFNEKNINDF